MVGDNVEPSTVVVKLPPDAQTVILSQLVCRTRNVAVPCGASWTPSHAAPQAPRYVNAGAALSSIAGASRVAAPAGEESPTVATTMSATAAALPRERRVARRSDRSGEGIGERLGDDLVAQVVGVERVGVIGGDVERRARIDVRDAPGRAVGRIASTTMRASGRPA